MKMLWLTFLLDLIVFTDPYVELSYVPPAGPRCTD